MFIKKAFTLVELLITLSIFAVVVILSAETMVNTMRSAREIGTEAFLHSEAQILMDQVAREVEQNAIDYEAYYLRNVQEESGWETENYGYYGQAFFHPGATDLSPLTGPYEEIEGYGVLCSDGSSYYPEGCPTETPTYADVDLDTGAHPFTGIDDFLGYDDDPTLMNALCRSTDSICNDLEHFVTDELILINSAGDERTIFVRELFNAKSDEYRLSKVELTGTDSDSDGLVDLWVCSSKYSCTGPGGVPKVRDLTNTDDPQEDFMPIAASTLAIEDFYVYLAPLEDPYRAFAEEDVQIQPQVKILMTVTLSEKYGSNFLGDPPSITLQRTVSTGVYSKITTYE